MRTQPALELTRFHGLLTVAPQMRAFFDLLERVARSDSTVLIRGESGTGKELVARALHQLSPRAEGPFRALNCATLTSELLASELFGHVRGAFTGAIRDRTGLLALANRGTIFLDEIAEMPVDVQARLLRVLQERSFTPLGSATSISVNVRVLSATHQALRERVEQGQFREDLMYRVRVVPVFLPPLADRDGDVEALAWHFIGHFNARGHRRVEGIAEDAFAALEAYAWPGNIRELRNVVEYAFAVGEGPCITLNELTPELRGEDVRVRATPSSLSEAMCAEASSDAVKTPSNPRANDGAAGRSFVEELERDRIIDALRASAGRKGEAAAALGMSRSTLWRKLREHGLD